MFANNRPQSCLLSHVRNFSNTSCQAWKSNKNALAEAHANLPAYPHGPALWYKQSNNGLYGGARIRFGNNVSPDTETKTRRSWHPNIKQKYLFSKALNRGIRVKVSTRVLRTIDKVGGLDNYLLGEKSARIRELGMGGWRLRCMVMATETVQKRFNAQRRELGLPEVDYAALALETRPPEEAAMLEPGMQEFVVESIEGEGAEGDKGAPFMEEQPVEDKVLVGARV